MASSEKIRRSHQSSNARKHTPRRYTQRTQNTTATTRRKQRRRPFVPVDLWVEDDSYVSAISRATIYYNIWNLRTRIRGETAAVRSDAAIVNYNTSSIYEFSRRFPLANSIIQIRIRLEINKCPEVGQLFRRFRLRKIIDVLCARICMIFTIYSRNVGKVCFFKVTREPIRGMKL